MTAKPQLPEIRMGERGVEVNSLEQAFRFGNAVIQAGFAPRGATPTGVAISVAFGAELGMSPLQSIQNIAVINGKPSIYGDAAIALIHQSGLMTAFKETTSGSGNSLEATCHMKRKGGGEVTSTFSANDANLAGLWGKTGPWKSYPKRMLQMRARGFAARDLFADVLGGLISSEEAEDYPKREPRPLPNVMNAGAPPDKEPEPVVEVEAREPGSDDEPAPKDEFLEKATRAAKKVLKSGPVLTDKDPLVEVMTEATEGEPPF